MSALLSHIAQFMQQHNNGFKRFVLQLIQDERYLKHEKAIEKISKLVNNNEEYKELGDFLISVWESGFLRAVEENKEGLKKLGFKVNIKSNQDEKSG